MHKLLLSILFLLGLAGCASKPFEPSSINDWQPKIVNNRQPDHSLFDPIEYYTVNRHFADFLPIVPTYNHQGNLLASWNPQPDGVKNHPTFVFVHGGHGITGSDIGEAVWARKELKANVLILDSYWSRGIKENFRTKTEYGANMRALDSIAAGRFVLSQGVDTNSIFLMGDSQGGWTVLRTMTDEQFYIDNAKPIFAAGIALYPNCQDGPGSLAPRLGPYHSPVLIFTGGKDTATPYYNCSSRVFDTARSWTNYPDATHGFDSIGKGGFKDPPVDHDGECHNAMNTAQNSSSPFVVCRSNSATNDMHNKVKLLVRELTNYKL